MSFIVCDSCGRCETARAWDGAYYPAIDWTMCSQCEFDGRLDEWEDAGRPTPAMANYFE